MIVRSVDANNDWNFGKGRNDYLSNNAAIEQSIKTRLQSFLGDCFFALDVGIDWFNLLGSKNQIALELAVRAIILNTDGVTSLSGTPEVILNTRTRQINMKYSVYTIYSAINNTGATSVTTSFLLTESGDILTTESGAGLELG